MAVMGSCCALLFLMFSLLSGIVGGDEDEEKYWGKSPLPIFTQVKVKHYDENNSTSISVRYKANQRPHYRWFVNDIPFVGGRGNFFLNNHYDGFMLCMTTIIVPDDLGRRFAICLQTPDADAENCLYLRDLPTRFEEHGEDVDFPWPLLVPSPVARYSSSRKVRIFAPQLSVFSYAYSGQFFFQNRADPQPLRQVEFMPEVPGEDVVSMVPVTSGSPGWLVDVNTDAADYEGVMLFRTTIRPTLWSSAFVKKSVSTRFISIYNRQHSGPFPNNTVTMLPQPGGSLPVTCRRQRNLHCLIACPFAINGDLHEAEMHLARVKDNGATIVPLPRTSLSALARRTGSYTGEAMFNLNASDDAESGVYQCSVTMRGNTSSTLVALTVV